MNNYRICRDAVWISLTPRRFNCMLYIGRKWIHKDFELLCSSRIDYQEDTKLEDEGPAQNAVKVDQGMEQVEGILPDIGDIKTFRQSTVMKESIKPHSKNSGDFSFVQKGYFRSICLLSFQNKKGFLLLYCVNCQLRLWVLCDFVKLSIINHFWAWYRCVILSWQKEGLWILVQ